MGDEGEFWKVVKEESRLKKNRNYKNALKVLEKEGIDFVVSSNPSHLIIENRIDYWPSTGLFIIRKTKKKGRGIRNLLKEINR